MARESRPDGGFLLLEILMSIGVLAMAGLAAIDGVRAASAAEMRSSMAAAVADCAERRFVELVSAAPVRLGECDQRLTCAVTVSQTDNRLETVILTISADNQPPETFETVRRAR